MYTAAVKYNLVIDGELWQAINFTLLVLTFEMHAS